MTMKKIIVRLREKGQVTIPREIARAAGLAPGDVLELEVVGAAPRGRKLRVRPMMVVDRRQR